MRSLTVLMSRNVCASVTAILGVSALLLTGGTAALAQGPPAFTPPAQHAMTDADQNAQLREQIAELRAQVARLQAAVQQTGPGKKVPAKPGMNMSPASNKGMGMMDEKSEMGMPAGKGAMPAGSAPMGMKDDQGEMPAPAAAMGMCCMGDKPPAGSAPMSGMPPSAGGMAPMSGPSSAMPGQPGASHLYHIGSNGFFLNHSQHITLTADQKARPQSPEGESEARPRVRATQDRSGRAGTLCADGRGPVRQLEGSGKNRRDRKDARRTANEFHPPRWRRHQRPDARSASGSDGDDAGQQEVAIEVFLGDFNDNR